MLIDTIHVNGNTCLSNLTEKDASDDYVSWMNDSKVNQFLESRFRKWSKEDLKPYIKNMNESLTDIHLGIFNEGEHIGNLSLRHINKHHKRADVAFLIGDEKHRGKGIMSASVKVLVKHAFNNLDLDRIFSSCYQLNIKSKKCLIKAGFEPAGRVANYFVYKNFPIDTLYFMIDK